MNWTEASRPVRFTSLLSANGRETGVIAIAFGAWLHHVARRAAPRWRP